MKYFIFDYNGTILDDVDIAIKAENDTIKHFNLNRISLDKDEYLHIFTFPVKDYYHNVGFDWNVYSYEEVGSYWFDRYSFYFNEVELYPGIEDILKKNIENGYINICLSSAYKLELNKQLKDFNIDQYFEEIIGTDDIYGTSKINNALKWLNGKNPDDCIFIGDTLHDLDTAKAMNVKCVLVSKGHQAKDVLLKSGATVVDDIRDIKI